MDIILFANMWLNIVFIFPLSQPMFYTITAVFNFHLDSAFMTFRWAQLPRPNLYLCNFTSPARSLVRL